MQLGNAPTPLSVIFVGFELHTLHEFERWHMSLVYHTTFSEAAQDMVHKRNALLTASGKASLQKGAGYGGQLYSHSDYLHRSTCAALAQFAQGLYVFLRVPSLPPYLCFFWGNTLLSTGGNRRQPPACCSDTTSCKTCSSRVTCLGMYRGEMRTQLYIVSSLRSFFTLPN